MKKPRDIVKLRRWCIRRRGEGVPVSEICTGAHILTDHGSQFYSVRRGESSFDAYCEAKGINHILGGIGKPTTLGKIERWFRTYD